MTGFGAKAYSQVAVDTGAGAATSDPHALVLMLFDGALTAARQGLGHMQAGRVAEKAAALSKVTRIIDEGLKLSLDKSAGGPLAQRLGELYDYMTMRLLQSNLRNDAAALAEVIKLLDELRGAWAQLNKQPAPQSASQAAQPVQQRMQAPAPVVAPVAAPAAQGPSASTAARFFDAAYPQPLRRVATA
jgi:flagellar protein FliS